MSVRDLALKMVAVRKVIVRDSPRGSVASGQYLFPGQTRCADNKVPQRTCVYLQSSCTRRTSGTKRPILHPQTMQDTLTKLSGRTRGIRSFHILLDTSLFLDLDINSDLGIDPQPYPPILSSHGQSLPDHRLTSHTHASSSKHASCSFYRHAAQHKEVIDRKNLWKNRLSGRPSRVKEQVASTQTWKPLYVRIICSCKATKLEYLVLFAPARSPGVYKLQPSTTVSLLSDKLLPSSHQPQADKREYRDSTEREAQYLQFRELTCKST